MKKLPVCWTTPGAVLVLWKVLPVAKGFRHIYKLRLP
jgi:hypothetical protein